MLQKENALELAKKIFKDEEELAVMHDYLHSCAHGKYLLEMLQV